MITCLASAMLFMGSCMPSATSSTSTSQSNNTAMLNGSWKLVSLNGKTINVSEESRRPRITFVPTEQRVNGFAGCNSFFGGFTAAATQISFTNIGATRMACHDDTLEQPFLAVISDTSLMYQVTATTLKLMKNNQSVMEFSRTQDQ